MARAGHGVGLYSTDYKTNFVILSDMHENYLEIDVLACVHCPSYRATARPAKAQLIIQNVRLSE